MKTNSALEARLAAGKFAVTAEIGPPKSADPEFVRRKAAALVGLVDGANVTDNQTATVRMSSIAGAVIVKQAGVAKSSDHLPRPEPHRHSERRPGCGRPGLSTALHDRDPSKVGNHGREGRFRSSHQPAADHASGICATLPLPERRKNEIAAAHIHRWNHAIDEAVERNGAG